MILYVALLRFGVWVGADKVGVFRADKVGVFPALRESVIPIEILN